MFLIITTYLFEKEEDEREWAVNVWCRGNGCWQRNSVRRRDNPKNNPHTSLRHQWQEEEIYTNPPRLYTRTWHCWCEKLKWIQTLILKSSPDELRNLYIQWNWIWSLNHFFMSKNKNKKLSGKIKFFLISFVHHQGNCDKKRCHPSDLKCQ